MKPNAKESGSRSSSANGHPPVSKATAPTRATRKTKAAAAGATSDERSPYAESLLEACKSIPRLQSFTSAIGTAGLADLLSGAGPLTIFAPTDKAFGKMRGGELEALLGDKVRLGEFIRHHVVSGKVSAPRETRPRKVTPQFGEDLPLTRTPQGFRVAEARIVKTNIRASNGIIHAIDRVLDPG